MCCKHRHQLHRKLFVMSGRITWRHRPHYHCHSAIIAMPELPDDHVDSIKAGTLVYWMDQDEDVPRGAIGEVHDMDGNDCVVEFPKRKIQVPVNKLNVSDFQKGTFIYLTDDGLADDTMGQVKGTSGENGKLLIEIEGEEKEVKPKYLFKCDFQIGMFVLWKKSDDDIPAGHVGQVLDDMNEKGKVKVKFPNGSWRFRPKDLVKSHVQPGSYVQWTDADDDVGEGEIGEATGDISDSGKLEVAFSKGTWNFWAESLILYELQLGAFVRWQKIDEDVKKGDLGQVVGIKVSQGRLRVQFPKGQWKFKANDLSLCRIQPGNLVLWTQSDEDIPRGDIGEVIRLDDRKLSIQWPQGHWSMKINEIQKCRHQKGDRVQWTKSDDDIPEGSIGIVMGIRYGEDSGDRLYVNWPKGRWSMKPLALQALNFDADGANQLKLAFKRFDANGDGKLSEEEFLHVLGKLGGSGGGLAPEECKQLFKALDQDENGKLTVSEFIDYVFSDASGGAKMVLADGFGLDAFLGFAGQEEESHYKPDEADEDDMGKMKGPPPRDRPPKASKAEADGIGDTEVSKAVWATAMLTVGVPRAAAVASFDAVTEELGGNGDVLKLKDLAAELNLMGGAAGVEELCDPIAQVKNGNVKVIDLETPSEDVEIERDLARKTGLDGLVFDCFYNCRSLTDAAKDFGAAKLSALEKKVLGDMSDEDLVEAVLKTWKSSESLSAVASWQRARENCHREVQEIIDECRSQEKQYTDPDFNPVEDEAKVMYVDKKKPGWDCSVGEPKSWQRNAKVRPPLYLVKNAAEFSDVHQGSIGDCFFVAALAALASARKSFFRQAFVHYDVEVGVYGVMFCEEMHFTYEIVDNYLGHGGALGFQYARSDESRHELWVAILEKAYFKHLTCLEMCDGGWGPDAIFSFVGGVWAQRSTPGVSEAKRFWKRIDRALQDGEIMTNGFHRPSKGKYAHLSGEDGQCGEEGIAYGLHDGHCYSFLRAEKVDGHYLFCMRNPWAHGEWKGPWSDKSKEWTDEAREKLGVKKDDDGVFWMAAEDFVQLSRKVRYNKTFGPTWQCVAQYGNFGKAPPFTAIAKHSYRACEDDEITFKRGEKLEVTTNHGGSWLKGIHQPTGKKGYFRKKDVDMKCEDTFKYELSVSNMKDGDQIIIALFRQNIEKMRKWYRRKQDGVNYKDTDYSDSYLYVYGSNDRRLVKLCVDDRHDWQYLEPSKGPFKIYVSCKATEYQRFALYAFAPHGELRLKQLDCDRGSWMTEVGARSSIDNMREALYSQTADTVNEYMHLGFQLLNDYPQAAHVAESVMDVASTVGEYLDVEDAGDRVRDFVNSDRVQNVADQVQDLIHSDAARELTNQVGSLVNRASSWFG